MEPRETQEANSIDQLAAEMVEMRAKATEGRWVVVNDDLEVVISDDANFIAFAANHAADIARWAMKLKAELDEGVRLARQLEHDETEQTAYKLVQWANGCGSSHTPQPIVDRLMEENAKLKAELDAAKKGIHARDVERTISEGYIKMLENAQLRWPKPGVDSTPKEPGPYWHRKGPTSAVIKLLQVGPDDIEYGNRLVVRLPCIVPVISYGGEWVRIPEPLEPEGDK